MIPTKGKWKAMPFNESLCAVEIEVEGDGYCWIGAVYGQHGTGELFPTNEEAIANGHLFAASKEMLGVLEHLAFSGRGHGGEAVCPCCNVFSWGVHDDDCKLNNAIKKAKGELK